LSTIISAAFDKLKGDPIVTDSAALAVWHVFDVSC
jgi:hypothetical protein